MIENPHNIEGYSWRRRTADPEDRQAALAIVAVALSSAMLYAALRLLMHGSVWL